MELSGWSAALRWVPRPTQVNANDAQAPWKSLTTQLTPTTYWASLVTWTCDGVARPPTSGADQAWDVLQGIKARAIFDVNGHREFLGSVPTAFHPEQAGFIPGAGFLEFPFSQHDRHSAIAEPNGTDPTLFSEDCFVILYRTELSRC